MMTIIMTLMKLSKGEGMKQKKGTKGAAKRTTQTGGFLQTIRGKILLMGGTAILASCILGAAGVIALNKNSRNNEVLTEMNRINQYQYQNQSLEPPYRPKSRQMQRFAAILRQRRKILQSARRIMRRCAI